MKPPTLGNALAATFMAFSGLVMAWATWELLHTGLPVMALLPAFVGVMLLVGAWMEWGGEL